MAGKKYRKAVEGWDPTKRYSVDEACAILPRTKISAKWDETVDAAVRLGVNPKYADQMVRGSVVMPNGTGYGPPRGTPERLAGLIAPHPAYANGLHRPRLNFSITQQSALARHRALGRTSLCRGFARRRCKALRIQP